MIPSPSASWYTANDVVAGHKIGAEIEQDFTTRAKSAGMSEEQAKNAYNQNMMGGGLLASGAAEFAKEHGRRWLLTDYEAGDVVFHNSYAVSWTRKGFILSDGTNKYKIHASTINYDPENVIRLGTDLRYVDQSRPWDTVSQQIPFRYCHELAILTKFSAMVRGATTG